MACRRPSLRFRPPVPWWFRPPAPRRVLPTARLWVRPPAPCRGLHQLLYRSFPIPSAYALSPVRLPPAADRAATSCKILPVPRAPSAADRAATSLKILPVPRAPSAAGCAAAFQNPVSANARAVSPRARPRGRFLIHPRRAGFFRLRRIGMAAGFACVPPARGFPRIASIMVHGSGLLRCAGARPCQRVRRRFGISSVRAAAAYPSLPCRCGVSEPPRQSGLPPRRQAA